MRKLWGRQWSQDGDGHPGCELIVRNQCSHIQTSDTSPVKIQPNFLPDSTYKNQVGSILGIKICSVSCAFPRGLQFAPQTEPITSYQVENHTKLASGEALLHGLLKAEQIFMIGLVLVCFGILIVITVKGMNCLFVAKYKSWPELWTYTNTKTDLDEMLPSLVQWAKDSLRAIPQARLALECAILFHSHCDTSPCPPAALAKGNQYSRLCHSRQGSFGYTSVRAGADIQHYSFSERSMVDEYFLPPQPSWANSHLDNEVTYFQLTFCVKRSADNWKHIFNGISIHGILSSLQHVLPRELAVALLVQVDKIHLSLPLSSPATTYIHHLLHWLQQSSQLFCCSKVPSLPLWLPLLCQSFPALYHAPLHVYKVLPQLPHSDSSFLSSPLSISPEGSQHASEGWTGGPQKKLSVLFRVI